MRTSSRPTILFASELGGGRGHIARLNAVAMVAKRLGLVTRLAVRPDRELHRLTGNWHFDDVIAAPRFPRLRNPPPALQVGGLAAVLAKVGFIDHKIISSVVAEWQTIIAAHRPQIVVGDFAPFARLASLRQVPFLMVGSGYTTPLQSGLHSFDMVNLPSGTAQLSAHMLTAINKAQAKNQNPELNSVADALRGDWTTVASIPALDPVPKRSTTEYAGPFVNYPTVQRPKHNCGQVYAYLHSVDEVDRQLLSILVQNGLQVELYVSNGDMKPLKGLTLLKQPLELPRIAKMAQAVYHQGGLGLSTGCAVYGVPQILTPKHAEARMTSAQLVKLNLGRRVGLLTLDQRNGVMELLAWLNDPAVNEQLTRDGCELRNWITAQNWEKYVGGIFERYLSTLSP